MHELQAIKVLLAPGSSGAAGPAPSAVGGGGLAAGGGAGAPTWRPSAAFSTSLVMSAARDRVSASTAVDAATSFFVFRAYERQQEVIGGRW